MKIGAHLNLDLSGPAVSAFHHHTFPHYNSPNHVRTRGAII